MSWRTVPTSTEVPAVPPVERREQLQPLAGEHIGSEEPLDQRADHQWDRGNNDRADKDRVDPSLVDIDHNKDHNDRSDRRDQPQRWDSEHSPVRAELANDCLVVGEDVIWECHVPIIRRSEL